MLAFVGLLIIIPVSISLSGREVRPEKQNTAKMADPLKEPAAGPTALEELWIKHKIKDPIDQLKKPLERRTLLTDPVTLTWDFGDGTAPVSGPGLSVEHRFAVTGGSDAHILSAIGASRTVFPGSTAADLRRAIEERTTKADVGSFWLARNLRYARNLPGIMRRDPDQGPARR
ncbi:MAG: hypothetical protein CVU65_16565 [Deltaproteobacteria bacterium HGW-Deltaproteobacteria-22]|nr:MAG: hypothetical protein CVU65_16565 [Deltaproteobacteria bacterium HGW-Deltaproteobacteria-22]